MASPRAPSWQPATGFVCGAVPYTCDGFDPADWPDGAVPDMSLFREWERRQAAHLGGNR